MRRGILLTAVTAAAVLTGCGGDQPKDTRPDITVRGKLIDNGKAWVYEEPKGGAAKMPPGVLGQPPGAPGTAGGGGLQVVFKSMDGADVKYVQLDTNTGTFTANGLKPGRYKIALFNTSTIPGAADPFKGKFTQDKTKIVRDLKDGDDVTIDVSKETG